MKCEICGQEVANSVELDKHKEREHPMGGDEDKDLERPDLAPEQVPSAPVVPGRN